MTKRKKQVKEVKTSEKNLKKVKKRDSKPFVLLRPLIAIGQYFHDSWLELRQVRWPDRKTTWQLVAAVLIYSAFFMILIMLLDAIFSAIFNNLLG